MDSISQMALGAAVCEAAIGRKAGRKAWVWGAVLGTFPDLDVVIPLADPVLDFTWHRGPSHSLFVLALLTPLLAAIPARLHQDNQSTKYRHWILAAGLVLLTHVLLDCFTVYGTQALWPLPVPPVAWSSIFIIDPAYTVPLLLGSLFLLGRRRAETAFRANRIGLAISTGYLAWSLAAQQVAGLHARRSAQTQGIPVDRMLAVPMPFNTLGWRILIMDGPRYHEGFYSLFDGGRPIAFSHHPSGAALLEELRATYPVNRLLWFTHGFSALEEHDGSILMTDLRMGMEPSYVFRFKVAERTGQTLVPVKPLNAPSTFNTRQLGWVWKRLFQPGLPPPAVYSQDHP